MTVSLDNLRKIIEEELHNSLKNEQINILSGFTDAGSAYGHEAGAPVERWVKTVLEKIKWDIKVYIPNELLQQIFARIGKNRTKIEELSQDVWWGPLLISKQQIDQFLKDAQIKSWQQAGADIILFYGKDVLNDIEDVVLLNVKSHAADRASRPPNIMSAQRLLVYFAYILEGPRLSKKLEKMNIWFVGIDHATKNGKTRVVDANIRDLFALDLSELPQINFDAAIQIQWHVKDMVETDQDKLTFMINLAETFLKQWHLHSHYKEDKYVSLVKKIVELARSNQKTLK
jgi:hypothetical protein